MSSLPWEQEYISTQNVEILIDHEPIFLKLENGIIDIWTHNNFYKSNGKTFIEALQNLAEIIKKESSHE